jgi:hypothetical protein
MCDYLMRPQLAIGPEEHMATEVRLVQLPAGEPVWVKVAVVGPQDISRGTPSLDVEGLLETVTSVAKSVRVAAAKAKPDSVSVEFGVEVTAKAGKLVSVLADVGGSATLKITLNWTSASDVAEAAAP